MQIQIKYLVQFLRHRKCSTNGNFEEKDVAFYKNIENASKLVLKDGDFAIFFPEDAHKPCCALNNEPSKVKKVVVKVAVA